MHILRFPAIAALAWALVLPLGARADTDAGEIPTDEPDRWQQNEFPSPIVGSPPDIGQFVQFYASYFTGSAGEGFVPSAEFGWLLSSRLGLQIIVPFQIGFDGQATGFGDSTFLAQYLTAGSLRFDNMISVGVASILPTGRNELSLGDWFVGPFVFAAQRLWKRLTLELNVTALIPVIERDFSEQIQFTGFAAVLLSPIGSDVPLYVQVETNGSTFLGGTSATPAAGGGASAVLSSSETIFLAPEVSVGPFSTPIGKGLTLIGGVFVNLTGSPTHRLTYTVTAIFDLPNRYGY